MNADPIPRTLGMAVAVALACSALVAGSVHVLRPIQHAYQQLDRNRAILAACGHPAATGSDREAVAAYLDLDVRLVDLERDELTDGAPIGDPRDYDHWAVTAEAPPELRAAPPAPLGQPARYVPVYLVWEGARLQRAVLPVHGPGMWSTLRGYLAVEADFTTVAALHIYQHGETPGIGDRIEDARWLATWTGKRLFASDGNVRIDVVRQPTAPAFQVDVISGASVTSDALGDVVRAWVGPDGYGPLLLRSGRGEISLQPRGANRS